MNKNAHLSQLQHRILVFLSGCITRIARRFFLQSNLPWIEGTLRFVLSEPEGTFEMIEIRTL